MDKLKSPLDENIINYLLRVLVLHRVKYQMQCLYMMDRGLSKIVFQLLFCVASTHKPSNEYANQVILSRKNNT